MTTLLMVCLGNICRSPLAEGIMRSKLPKDQFFIDSAGTSGFHSGEQPDPRSIEVARTHGIDISDQKSRQFFTSDFETFDHIFVMDHSNYDDVIAKASTPEERNKVKLLLSALPEGQSQQVPDPYYGGPQGFEHVYQLIDEACERIASGLLENQ